MDPESDLSAQEINDQVLFSVLYSIFAPISLASITLFYARRELQPLRARAIALTGVAMVALFGYGTSLCVQKICPRCTRCVLILLVRPSMAIVALNLYFVR